MSKRSYYSDSSAESIAYLIILAIIIVFTIISVVYQDGNKNTYVATVTEKSVMKKDKDDKYLIYTKLEDGSTKVFEDVDSFIEGKYNSSDVYAEIQVGKKIYF